MSTSAPSLCGLEHDITGGRGSSKLVTPRRVPFLLSTKNEKNSQEDKHVHSLPGMDNIQSQRSAEEANV